MDSTGSNVVKKKRQKKKKRHIFQKSFDAEQRGILYVDLARQT